MFFVCLPFGAPAGGAVEAAKKSGASASAKTSNDLVLQSATHKPDFEKLLAKCECRCGPQRCINMAVRVYMVAARVGLVCTLCAVQEGAIRICVCEFEGCRGTAADRAIESGLGEETSDGCGGKGVSTVLSAVHCVLQSAVLRAWKSARVVEAAFAKLEPVVKCGVLAAAASTGSAPRGGGGYSTLRGNTAALGSSRNPSRGSGLWMVLHEGRRPGLRRPSCLSDPRYFGPR